LLNNQYYNGGAAIPTDPSEEINFGADLNRIVADPELPSLSGLVLPRWNATADQFADGSTTIRDAFVNLVMRYGAPAGNSGGVDHALPGQSPQVDILGNPRGALPDVGAFEIVTATGDFDGDGDVDGRDFLVWQRDPSVGALSDWQANYGGGSLTSSAAVPEPPSAGLVLAASLTLGALFARKR
jgi:hypothetical protein